MKVANNIVIHNLGLSCLVQLSLSPNLNSEVPCLQFWLGKDVSRAGSLTSKVLMTGDAFWLSNAPFGRKTSSMTDRDHKIAMSIFHIQPTIHSGFKYCIRKAKILKSLACRTLL